MKKLGPLWVALLGALLFTSACSDDACKGEKCLTQADAGIDSTLPASDQALPAVDSSQPAEDGSPAAPDTTTADDSGTSLPPAGLVSVQQASQMIATGKITLLDVRDDHEFAAGHIEGALQLSWNNGEVEAQWNTLPTDKGVLVYCRSGNRSSQATALLNSKGLSPVWDMDGGITAWQAAGLPVVQ